MSANPPPAPVPTKVVVIDVEMRFWSMVVFMVKWVIASIPAFLILLALFTGAWLLIASLAIFSWKKAVEAPLPAARPSRSVSTPASATPVAENKEPESKPDETSVYLERVLVERVSTGKSVLGEPGVFGEVKNTGSHTLKSVEITIFCLGADGNPVFEKTFHPVLETTFGRNEGPLKPGYSRKFGVKVDDAPSSWKGKVKVKLLIRP